MPPTSQPNDQHRGGRGPVALVGGNEFTQPARPLDAWLLERSGGDEVLVVPTAAARHHPEMAVETAAWHFGKVGGRVEGVMVLDRAAASDPRQVDRLAAARFVYLPGGDPPVVADVLRGTPAWEAILAANAAGGVLAGSSAGAMVLGPHMLAPPWEEPVEGLGLLPDVVVVPHFDRLDAARRDRYVDRALRVLPGFADGAVRLVGVYECTGVVLGTGGRVDVLGGGAAFVYEKGEQVRRWTAPAEGERWE
ncbi:MAG: Type 1 glutamine amidotransferase-like domain-containing protein [Actinomycetota bacterium]